MSHGAREDSKDVARGGNPLKNMEKGLEGRETVEDSYYYQFACLRSLDLPLSSFHLDDARGLFPPIYFLDPNKRLAFSPSFLFCSPSCHPLRITRRIRRSSFRNACKFISWRLDRETLARLQVNRNVENSFLQYYVYLKVLFSQFQFFNNLYNFIISIFTVLR